MPKVSLNTIGSRYGSIDALNANFDDIEAAIENTLSLDGTSPNAMTADLDLNSNDLLNVGTTNTQTLYINGVEVEPNTGVSAGSAFQTYSFTATAGQTTFSVAPATPLVSSLLVSVNGLELPPADVTVSTTNVIIPACTLGDEVVVRRFTKEPTVYPTAATQDFQQAGTGAQIRTVQSKLRDVVSASDFGAVADGVTNNTASVQSAINSLGTYGGTVYIKDGCKFNLKSLTLPARCNIDYRVDDDTGSSGQGSVIASSERVLFSSNSSYPASPTGGIVNEWRFTAPFHPGVVVDVRKDVTSAATYLGPGQSMTAPVRASYNIIDEESVGRWTLQYQNYDTWSNFSGLYNYNFRPVVTLNGIGTAQWTSVPAANTVITGTTSGAKGFLLSVAAGSTAVLWFSGKFVAGETLSDNNETTTATVSSVSFSNDLMQWLAQDFKRGNWSIGLPPGVPTHLFAVGGKIAATKSRNASQYIDDTITNPAYVWVDDYEAGTPNGFEVTYNVAPAAASRRLTLRKLNQTTDIGHVGAVAAHASCTDGAGSPAFRAGSFNMASIARGGTTGRYDFTFSNALPTANFRILASPQFNGFITWDLKATTGFSVFVANASGVAQWAPFDFEVVVIGGDI